jgi:integrase/recombinase XerD
MNDIILKYIESIKKKNLSKNTLDAYIRDLHNFSEFIKFKKVNYKEVDIVCIMSFVQYLKKDGKANSSIVRHISSIRNFYKYLIRQKMVDEDPTMNYEIPKVKRNLPQTLTVKEVEVLLAQPDNTTNKGKRDKAMLELMYATGMKVTELLNLSIFDINIEHSYIKCIGSKHRERMIPIGSYAVDCIRSYLEVRHEMNLYNYNFLFFNIKGQKMSRQGFWKIVKKYAEDANINKAINSYTLRHSFAVHLLQNGANISAVQELLGHSNMSATQIYTKISHKNKLSEIYKNAHPRA